MTEERNFRAKTMMTSSSRIPVELSRDIVEEIFARAPVNFIRRFLWTEKELTERLTSQAFAHRFQEVEREKPKALVCVSVSGNWFYESWSNRRQTPVTIRLCPMTEGLGRAYYYERELILYPRIDSRILLLNPSTTQRTIIAPALPKKVTIAFLGFDISWGLYQLLVACIEAEDVVYFLLTLGQREWKMIHRCGVTFRPHRPRPRMLSVNFHK